MRPLRLRRGVPRSRGTDDPPCFHDATSVDSRWGRHRLYPSREALGLYCDHPLRHGLVDHPDREVKEVSLLLGLAEPRAIWFQEQITLARRAAALAG